MAEISYDTIELKLNSVADTKGLTKAIRGLVHLKEATSDSLSGLGDIAKNMNEFVGSLNGISDKVINQYKSLADSVTKIAKSGNAAKKAVEQIEAPKLNTDKKEIRDFFDAFGKNFSMAEMKGFGYDPQAVREVKTELKLAKNEADALAKAQAESAKAEKAQERATAAKAAAEKRFNAEFERELKLEQKAEFEAKQLALFRERLAEEQSKSDKFVEGHNGSWAKQQKDIFTDYIKHLPKGVRDTAEEEFKAYLAAKKIAIQNREVAKSVDEYTEKISTAKGKQEELEAHIREIVSEYKDAPPVSSAFLKQQGYTTEEIVAAKQEITNMKFEAKKAKEQVGEIPKKAEEVKQATASMFESVDTKPVEMAVDDFKALMKVLWLHGGVGKAVKATGAKDLQGIVDNSAIGKARAFSAEVEKIETLLHLFPTMTTDRLLGKGFDPKAIAQAQENVEQFRATTGLTADAMDRAKGTANGLSEGIDGIGESAEKSLSPLQKLVHKFSEILKYRIMRYIITGISNAIKQGFTNLEQWDIKIGNTGFAESMATARESIEVLKNSLAVVGAPFLEFLVTILEKVARLIMGVANVASRLIAIFSGKSTYRTVEWADYSAKATDDYGHSLGKATKDAKEFKRQLMGFDEINNITAQNDNGTGSGGGGGAAKGGFNFKDMFGEESVGELNSFDKAIQELGIECRALYDWLTKVFTKASTVIGKVAEKVKGKLKEWSPVILDAQRNMQQTSDDFNMRINTVFPNFIVWLNKVQNVFKRTNRDMYKDIDATSEKFNRFAKLIGQILLAPFKAFSALVGGVLEMVASLADYIGTTFSNVKALITGKINLEQFKQNMAEAGNALKQNLGKAVSDIDKGLHNAFDTTWYLDVSGRIHIKEIDTSGLGSATMVFEKFASGGFPSTGQLFIAREAGAEMVGQIGGHTAVANNADIVNAVSSGVASAVASVLGNGNTNVEVVLEGDARGLFRVVQQQARNYTVQTGKYAFG